MRIGLDANFGSSFGVADRLGINSSAKVSPALGPGVGNRGADSDRITDRSTFVVGLIGSIRPDIAVRWFPRERLNLTIAVTRDWLNCRSAAPTKRLEPAPLTNFRRRLPIINFNISTP